MLRPPLSAKRMAASTLGPIDPDANWPSAAYACICASEVKPSGRSCGVP